ncbi:MAG: amino acid permease [Anaerolineales bacterium]|nr:amino acid permease [Anaerolineales bacterium]
MLSVILLAAFIIIAFRISPRECQEDAKVHGAGQIGLLAAVALFGVDYFTSYYYATGEMMRALHPYGLQPYAYIAVIVIAFANIVFGLLYMYSLGIFNEGGGSYTASMRYLLPTLSLIVAVVLIQDYIFTIVVSSLSGVDQLLSVLQAKGIDWIWHFLIGAGLVTTTWYLTIRGRGESARVTFVLLGVFGFLTITMFAGLLLADIRGVPPVSVTENPEPVSLLQAMYHMLTASMKGLVALTGLEAMSNGIQFVMDKDAGIVVWGKKHLPRFKSLWNFYSGKSGVGRFVQTSFLFYGGITTLLLTFFSIRFNVFDDTFGRTLVGNLAFIGFGQIPGFNILDGSFLFWIYQLLAVALLASASMTAFQDLQATAWRDVAIGEIPEIVVHRNPAGTFTRSVTAGYVAALIIMFLVRAEQTLAVPYYGIGVFMPIMVMGFAVRQHILRTYTGRKRFWGALAAGFSGILSALVFIGQIVGKWSEGGWVVLISFSLLILAAHAILISPAGLRAPDRIHRIVREKARVQGSMASIVEWQSLRMQEYRYQILIGISRFFEIFGVRRPMRFEPPAPAGEYDEAVHVDHPEAPSLLQQYLNNKPPSELQVGGRPKETAEPDENDT